MDRLLIIRLLSSEEILFKSEDKESDLPVVHNSITLGDKEYFVLDISTDYTEDYITVTAHVEETVLS